MTKENLSFKDKKDVMERIYLGSIKEAKLYMAQGNIENYSSEALITLISSDKGWGSETDNDIRKAAGNEFHNKAAEELRYRGSHLKKAQAVFISGEKINNSGKFKNIIFVTESDDSRLHLSQIVESGMQEAYNKNLKSVTMPIMRNVGEGEEPLSEIGAQMIKGIRSAALNNNYVNKGNAMEITIVFKKDTDGGIKRMLHAKSKIGLRL